MIVGDTTAFDQIVRLMELDHHQIDMTTDGQEMGLCVIDRVREGDEIYTLTE